MYNWRQSDPMSVFRQYSASFGGNVGPQGVHSASVGPLGARQVQEPPGMESFGRSHQLRRPPDQWVFGLRFVCLQFQCFQSRLFCANWRSNRAKQWTRGGRTSSALSIRCRTSKWNSSGTSNPGVSSRDSPAIPDSHCPLQCLWCRASCPQTSVGSTRRAAPSDWTRLWSTSPTWSGRGATYHSSSRVTLSPRSRSQLSTISLKSTKESDTKKAKPRSRMRWTFWCHRTSWPHRCPPNRSHSREHSPDGCGGKTKRYLTLRTHKSLVYRISWL